MDIKFVKLHKKAQAPYQATPGSAGFDLVAVTKEPVGTKHVKFGMGLAVEIPPGYVGLIFPRSSVYKSGMMLSNCVGVIDSDYRGEIKAVFLADGRHNTYEVGDRVCQMIISPVPQVRYVETDELSDTARGAGGYGSTGK